MNQVSTPVSFSPALQALVLPLSHPRSSFSLDLHPVLAAAPLEVPDRETRWNAGEDFVSDEEAAEGPETISVFAQRPVFCRTESGERVRLSDADLPVVRINSQLCEKALRNRLVHKREPDSEGSASTTKPESEGKKRYLCGECGKTFATGQGLGGHMSKRHPGTSESYKHKKTTRQNRLFDRARLFLAKKRYYGAIGIDYEEAIKTETGRIDARSRLNRARLRDIKRSINRDEVMRHIALTQTSRSLAGCPSDFTA